MTITEKVAQIRSKLDLLCNYQHMIDADNFEPGTVDDMKGNAKDICDVIKSLTDDIKAEIDNWE